jgi:5'-nucleotidase
MAADVVSWLDGAPAPTVINLSLPDRPRSELAEIRWGTLAPFGAVRAEVLERSDERIEVGLVPTGGQLPPDSDTALVEAGHPVVTALTGIRGTEPTGLVDHLSAIRAGGG